MNPLLLEVLLKEKRRALLEEAARQRLIAAYDSRHPGLRARFQLALGDFLIRLGNKIKRRYTGSLELKSDFCRDWE